MLSQPNIVSPLVRPNHANSFAGGVQRSPMGPPMSPNVGGGLMPHPRPQHPQHSQHPPRGPSGPPIVPRGTQAALKAEQDLKVWCHIPVSVEYVSVCYSGQFDRDPSMMGELTHFKFFPPSPSRQSSGLRCSSPLTSSSQSSSSSNSSNSRPRKSAKHLGSIKEENPPSTPQPRITRWEVIAQILTNLPSPRPSPYGLAP